MRVAVVAGEVSGDILGAGLIRALRSLRPDAEFFGIAGRRMQAEGCESLYPMERLSVMGLVEAAGRYLELLPVRRRLARDILARGPDVFVGIDAPDFNLGLEHLLRRHGARIVHYVSPSVWAWRSYRLKGIARAVDMVLALFPFEVPIYEAQRIPVRFVGHPLADGFPERPDRQAARARLGLGSARPVVALLPGSRMSEVTRLVEPMVAAAGWLRRRMPQLEFVVPSVGGETRQHLERVLAEEGGGLRCRVLEGGSREAMEASDVVLLASGTASLEAMLLKRPMVITYRTAELTWRVGKRMLHVDHVGLPNLLAGRGVVPELLQEQATPARLGAAVLRWLEHPGDRERLVGLFQGIHTRLRRGADQRAAEAVLEVATA